MDRATIKINNGNSSPRKVFFSLALLWFGIVASRGSLVTLHEQQQVCAFSGSGDSVGNIITICS